MTKSLPQELSGVLFDLDGTILDTAGDLGGAINYVLRKHNLPEMSESVYRPVVSDGALGLITLGFGEKLKDFDYQTLREELLDYYGNNLSENTFLYAGIAKLLARLDDKNIPWGIVTNKPEGLSKSLIPHYPELSTSGVLVGGDTLAKRKPDPEPLLFAAKELNIDPKRCLYIGDAPRDIDAGNAAGMFSIAAKWGYILDKSVCEEWQADMLAETPEEITAIIL